MLPTTFQGNQKQPLIKLLSLFLFGTSTARFADTLLSLHHSGHWEEGKTDHPGIHDLHLQFQGAFASFTFRVQTVHQWVATGVRRTVAGRRRRRCPKAFVALMSRQLMICFGCLLAQALFTWFHVHLVTQVWLLRLSSSQLASLSVVECWCPASFVEPLWSSLLSKALHISLHGG